MIDKILGWIMCVLGVVLMVLFVAMFYLAATQPSCSDLGGKSVFTHFTPVWTGKSMTLIANYRCEGAP